MSEIWEKKRKCEELGWRFDPMNAVFAYHAGLDRHADGEHQGSLEEFYDYLLRTTPKPPKPKFASSQAQSFWEEALKDLNKRVKEAEAALKNLQDYQLDVERRVREASHWKLHGDNWGEPTVVSWEELMAYVPRQANAGKKKVTMDITLDRITWRTGRRSEDRLAIAHRIVEKKETNDE